ncbi:MAG: hypothetical protein IK072_01345 [Clostridia bacterium]|nr:hypothetical protein [Clostridia bacterium]
MEKKNKFLKVLFWIIGTIAAILIIAVIGAYSYFKFVFVPKLSGGDLDTSESDTISFTEVAKELTDKQVIDNIINFDKQSASEMLSALNELEQEVSATNPKEETDNTKNADNKENTEVSVPAQGKTAYQRIMNEASKDEISTGMSIISKVDMSKVNELRRQGKTSEIKAYLKSVLSSSEISAALKLYNKYKHLL